MLTKRKAPKKGLDELRKIMPVLSEDAQRGYIGGSGNNSAFVTGCWNVTGSWNVINTNDLWSAGGHAFKGFMEGASVSIHSESVIKALNGANPQDIARLANYGTTFKLVGNALPAVLDGVFIVQGFIADGGTFGNNTATAVGSAVGSAAGTWATVKVGAKLGAAGGPKGVIIGAAGGFIVGFIGSRIGSGFF